MAITAIVFGNPRHSKIPEQKSRKTRGDGPKVMTNETVW